MCSKKFRHLRLLLSYGAFVCAEYGSGQLSYLIVGDCHPHPKRSHHPSGSCSLVRDYERLLLTPFRSGTKYLHRPLDEDVD